MAFNDLLSTESKIKEYQGTSWKRVKTSDMKRDIGGLLRRAAFDRRMSLLSCFNLVEAYINGLSWAYVQTHDISGLSQKKQNLLVQGQVSILDKLVKVPEIITGQAPGPLSQEREPLRLFKETIKPFRDSIVHASPFSAPERFGGYDKLSRVYDLTTETVKMAIDVSLEIITTVHRSIRGCFQRDETEGGGWQVRGYCTRNGGTSGGWGKHNEPTLVTA